MTPEERIKVGELWSLVAAMYGKELTRPVLKLMIDTIQDLPFFSVMRTLSDWPKVSKMQRHPLPVEIRDSISPAPSPEVEAREVIEKIKVAISRLGYMRGEEAKIFIGDVGWRIVEGLGGWRRVCESNFIHNSALIAQARVRGEDLINFQGNITTHNLLEHEDQKQIEY